MTKHIGTTTNAQHLRREIDSMLAEVEFHRVEPALAYLQAHHFSLYYTGGVRAPVDVWATEKVPITIRRTIRGHKERILALMHEGSAQVCPTPLHRKHQKRGVCQMCRRLEPSLEPVIAGDVVRSSEH